MTPEQYAEIAADCERGGTPLSFSYDDVADAEQANQTYDTDETFWSTERGWKLYAIIQWLWKIGQPPPPYENGDILNE